MFGSNTADTVICVGTESSSWIVSGFCRQDHFRRRLVVLNRDRPGADDRQGGCRAAHHDRLVPLQQPVVFRGEGEAGGSGPCARGNGDLESLGERVSPGPAEPERFSETTIGRPLVLSLGSPSSAVTVTV